MQILTTDGFKQFRPVSCPRAAPACVDLFKDYMRETNNARAEFNAAIASSTGPLKHEPLLPMVELPEWCVNAKERVY